MLYLKYMPFRSALNASRNIRELMAAKEYGFDVLLLSNDKPSQDLSLNLEIDRLYDGTTPVNQQMGLTEKIPLMIRNYLSVINKTINLPYGVWSCQDLASLRIAWILSRIRLKRPLLIYDSHEFELGRNARRTKRKLKSIQHWEQFLIKRCAFMIVVNDTIADEIQKIHGLEKRPVVVRSTPDYWKIEDSVCKLTRSEIFAELEKK